MEKCDCTDVDTCCGSFRLEMQKKGGGAGVADPTKPVSVPGEHSRA